MKGKWLAKRFGRHCRIVSSLIIQVRAYFMFAPRPPILILARQNKGFYDNQITTQTVVKAREAFCGTS